MLYLEPCCISVFDFGYKERLQKTAARIHTALVVVVVNVTSMSCHVYKFEVWT